MVLEWTFLCCSVSLHLKRSTPDIFQHQSTGYLRTRGQETLYEACACVIHSNCSCRLIYSCIIIPLYEMLHDRPFSVTSEESLRTT